MDIAQEIVDGQRDPNNNATNSVTMYRVRTACRACGFGSSVSPGGTKSEAIKEELIPVLDLSIQPLANDFHKPGDDCAGYAPLVVNFCPRCHLGQLSVEVDPAILYARNYSYVTSPSQTMREHFNRLELDLADRCERRGTIIEIGSNDGLLLDYFLNRGWKTGLGIDPAPNLNQACKERGVRSLPMFFDKRSADTALKAVGNPHLILARHVFCHQNDWHGFVNALEHLASDHTVIAIEVPWAQHMLERVEVDTCYHEHTSYLSLKSVEYLLKDSSLCLDEVIDYDIHGGAVLLILRDRSIATQNRAKERIEQEKISLEMWRTFAQHAELNIMELSAMVRNFVSQGKRVCGYGASAKSTVWVTACEFTKNEICFITDTTKGKWFTLSPGTNINIVDDGALTRELPEFAIMFCWNYMIEVLQKESIFRNKGGKWIIPRAKIEVV